MKYKIKKYLLKQEGVTLRSESSTESLYFNIDGFNAIRLSDHLGFDNTKMLHIILPHNLTAQFVIFLNNKPIIIEDYRKLKEFIKNYILIFRLLRIKNEDLDANVAEAVKEKVEEATSGLMAKIDAWVEARTVDEKTSKVVLNLQEYELITLYRKLHPKFYPGIINQMRLLAGTAKSISYQKKLKLD